jgi:hypothetical protein
MSTNITIKKERSRVPKKLPRKVVPEEPKQKLRGQLKEKEEKIEEKKEVENEEAKIKEETVYINSSINEVFATTEVIQYFINKLEKAIELKITFPLKPEIQLTKFEIALGDKTVISKVLDKEKAQEKYTDAIASGNTGLLASFDENYSFYTVNVGNVAPKETVKLTTLYNQMISTQDMSYEFSFMEHYPCFIYLSKKVQSKKINGKFILNTKSKITRLISPFMDETAKKSTNFNITFNENYTQAIIDFNKDIEIETVQKQNQKKRPKRPLHPALKKGKRDHLINQ